MKTTVNPKERFRKGFVLVMTLGLALVTVFPEIAMWLPSLHYGR